MAARRLCSQLSVLNIRYSDVLLCGTLYVNFLLAGASHLLFFFTGGVWLFWR